MAPKKAEGKIVPPYLPYRTFWNFILNLKQGIPTRIDRSVVPTMAGTAQSNLLAALRYLGLIRESGVPTELLPSLVNSEGSEQQRVLREILTGSYPFLFEDDFDLANASAAHFTEQMEKAGTTGDTTRKAAAFFLAAARHAEIPLSRHIVPKRGPRPTAPRKPRRPRVEPPADGGQGDSQNEPPPPPSLSWAQMLLAKFPSFDPAWPDEV